MLVCAGPLTNVAAALAVAPDIAERMTLVWVGGSTAPDVFEYNRDTDPDAARAVFAYAGLAIEWFPIEVYRRCICSVAELEYDLAGSGEVGAWLWQRFVELPLAEGVQISNTWVLGDSAPLVVTALISTWDGVVSSTGSGSGRTPHADVDLRLVLGDLLARLRLHEARSRR